MNRIKCLRKSIGLTQSEFAQRYNVDQTAVSNWEKGKNSIDVELAQKIADDFDIPLEFVYGKEFYLKFPIEQWGESLQDDLQNARDYKDLVLYRHGGGYFKASNEFDSNNGNGMESYISLLKPIQKKRFPMLGEIACGEPIYANEDHESYIDASASIDADFCLTAKGDSMIGVRIQDGDVVFIKQQPIVDNGEIAAVVIDGEATLKTWYYYPEKQKLVLNPANPAFEPLIYVGEELNTITCLGRAVCFMSNLGKTR